MDTEQITYIAGALLSLGFTYLPGLNTWFGKLAKENKKLVMLIVLALATAAVFGYSCAGQGAAFTCDQAGAWAAVALFIKAAIANQAAHRLTPKAKETGYSAADDA